MKQTPESAFRFDSELPILAEEGFVRTVPKGLGTKQALLRQLHNLLQFPDYCGSNWDAIEECIRDLSWLPPGRVVLAHQDLPPLDDPQDLHTYLSILRGAVKKFARSKDRRFVVAFPEQA